jgi:hypothetical protein
MAREKSELKSGIGKAVETFIALIEEVEDLGGSDEDTRRIKTDKTLRRQIAELLVSDRVISGRHNIVVNYDMPLANLIAAGRYDWKNGDINDQNFPISGSGTSETEIALFHFNKSMSTDVVLDELDKRGFRAATLRELLALGADQPELQRQFPIIALGSIWRDPCDNRGVAFLGRNGAERYLSLDWCEGDLGDFCRFAAVRKS